MYAERILAVVKINREETSRLFLLNEEHISSINGPNTATIKAKALNNHPALSMEILNAEAISGNTPITPNSVVVIPKTPRAST